MFQSFFVGGFECSCHYNEHGKRLDLIASTAHDRFALADYERLQQIGIRTARDGLRWHLIDTAPGHYDFSSFLPMVRAARETHTQVIWDLAHFGVPEGVDIFSAEFVDRFAQYARAATQVLTEESEQPPLIVPVNEISFWSWASAEAGVFDPFVKQRGGEAKRQYVRAAIAGIEAIWSVNPRARIVHVDPVIHVTASPRRPQDREPAERRRLSMYESWDMLAGRVQPELGGNEKYLDIIGVNYYPYNQWNFFTEKTIFRGKRYYRPFREILVEAYQRYQRPMFIAETGTEGRARVSWMRYVADEVCAAMQAGVPIQGICVYPITNYPGWADDRHCPTGLWGYADEAGNRPLYLPLARELDQQRREFDTGCGKVNEPMAQPFFVTTNV